MIKKIVILFFLFFLICLGLGLSLKAQKYPEEETPASDSAEGLSRLEEKIEGLNNELKGANREILKKLDQALSNQEKIFQELAIIKIRASKR